MKKKLILFVLLVFVSFNVFAIIPLILAGQKVGQVLMKTPAGQSLMAATVLAIGTSINKITVPRTSDGGGSRFDDLYLTNQPRPASAEEAAAGFSAGYPHVAPASTTATSQTGWLSYSVGGNFDSATSACAASSDSTHVYSVSGSRPAGGYYCKFTYTPNGQVVDPSGYVYPRVGCGTGYTLSGSDCLLTAPDAVPRPNDGFCPIVRSGNSYSADSTDPDCAGNSATPQFAADGTWSITGSDGHTVSGTGIDANGRIKIVDKQPNSSTGTTTTTTNHLQSGVTPDLPYLIIGGSTAETSGVGTAETTTPVSPTVSNTDVVNAISNQMAQERAIEDARIAKETLDRAIPVTSETIPKQSIPVTFAGVNFSSSAVCPPPIAFDMLGKHFAISYDPMCNLMSLMRPLFLALGAFSAAFIFMGAFKL